MTNLITHRPHGLEHPYAASADQRIPVLPLAGETCRLGVTATPGVVSVECEWHDGTTSQALELAPYQPDAADAAALAGGEGHLAAAQAGMLEAVGSWAVVTPPLEAGRRYRYRFTARTREGDEQLTDWYDVSAGTWTTEPRGRLVGADTRLVPGSVAWLVDADGVHRARFSLHLRPGDHVVGFGERFDHLDQAGRRLDAVVFEQYKSQGEHGRTYLPMPFAHVIGTDGDSWGFHVRTTRRTWYDVAATAADTVTVEVALGGSGDEAVDIGLYTGTPTDVLRAFLDEVGRAEELPDWVFRLWASGNEWNTQELVMGAMDRHRELDIPVGAVVIEAWSDEEGITIFRDAEYDLNKDGGAHVAADFTYPADGAWPDPKAMIEELHARGIKVILWQIPLQKTDPDLTGQVRRDADAMVREGHAVLEADGTAYHNRGWWFPQALMPDLSVPRTREWWAAKRRYLVRDLDVDGFKTDGGEHAWGHDLRYADGRRGDEGNNLFPVHYAQTFGDLLRSEGKAPVTFSRAGFTGSQAHGVFWAGDENSTWQAFRNSITAGLTAASCGLVYWGWDLAGFSGPVPDSELYLRATAASVFMPVMQYHSEFNHHQRPLRDRTPWHVAEINGGDDRVVPVFRRLVQLRERLVPYLTDQAKEAIVTDRPLMRPLFFDHADDSTLWQHPRQWKLGNHLLVSPVTEPGASEWTTYLPEGEWVNAWTGTTHTGRRTITTPVPLDQVPVFVNADATPALLELFAG
jgi:alpha-glucosidase (family GH31 glycosyl hydrolase)